VIIVPNGDFKPPRDRPLNLRKTAQTIDILEDIWDDDLEYSKNDN